MKRRTVRNFVMSAALLLILSAVLAPAGTANEALPTARPGATALPEPVSTRPVRPTRAADGLCHGPFESVSKPLTDLGSQRYVRMDGTETGFQGGLYPGGKNVRPPAHAAAALAMAKQIAPLNEQGQPDANGKIGFISVGMSNTMQEFRMFERSTEGRTDINPRLVLIDGAVAGQTASEWAIPDGVPWQVLRARLKHRKVTAEQVQVVWIKQTLTGGGDFPDKTKELEDDLAIIVRMLKQQFPNLRIAYLSSRTRGYTYVNGLSPEPLAFETGFAVKWLVERQLKGDASLNFDPKRGQVVAPLLTWGPYLWVDGSNPRSDGQVWTQLDLRVDCTHPSDSGTRKVADMLMTYYMTDPTATWFRAPH